MSPLKYDPQIAARMFPISQNQNQNQTQNNQKNKKKQNQSDLIPIPSKLVNKQKGYFITLTFSNNSYSELYTKVTNELTKKIAETKIQVKRQ